MAASCSAVVPGSESESGPAHGPIDDGGSAPPTVLGKLQKWVSGTRRRTADAPRLPLNC